MPSLRIPQVLQETTFTRYLMAVIVSSLGGGMANVALAFAMLELGGVTELGIVILAREIPLVIFVLLGGVFADRWRPESAAGRE
jgi:MFS family permease